MKTPMLVYLFNNAADLQVCIFIKKRIQYRYKAFKNVYFKEHLQTSASGSRIWLSPVIVKT